jgi:hypothetical protein
VNSKEKLNLILKEIYSGVFPLSEKKKCVKKNLRITIKKVIFYYKLFLTIVYK